MIDDYKEINGLVNESKAVLLLEKFNQVVDGQYTTIGRTYPEKVLAESQILEWADLFYKRNNAWPNQNSESIHEMEGNTWKTIDQALRYSQIGLRRSCGLSRFLGMKRGYVPANGKSMPDISIEDIVEYMLVFWKLHGRWPNYSDGAISEGSPEKWSNLNAALSKGGRGLRSGSSLIKLIPLALRIALLERGAISQDNPLSSSVTASFGRFEIEISQHSIKFGADEIALSSNQYLVMCALLFFQGKIISWAEIEIFLLPPDRRGQVGSGKMIVY